MTLTQKQETFCLGIFQGLSQRAAWGKAGYSTKYGVSVIDANASRLANSSKIQARLIELRQKAEDASVMDVLERKQRLTEIARARLTDFMEMGQDGTWVNIGPEVPMTGAIQEMSSRTEYDDDGAKPTVHTRVKLHDPTKAIDLLNKMDRIYTDGTQVNVDNRSVNFIVRDAAEQSEMAQLMEALSAHNTDKEP